MALFQNLAAIEQELNNRNFGLNRQQFRRNTIIEIKNLKPKSYSSIGITNGEVEDSNSKSNKNLYWKQKLLIVSSPFILFGLPIHILFNIFSTTTTTTTNSTISINNCSTEFSIIKSFWKKFNMKSIISSLILSTISLIWLIFTLLKFYTIFYNLVILGEINSQVITSTKSLINLLPIIIPILLVWINSFGIKYKELLIIFDIFKPHLLKLAQIDNNSEIINPHYLRPSEESSNTSNNATFWHKLKLLLIYWTIFGVILIQLLLIGLKEEDSATAAINIQELLELNNMLDIVLLFSLPIYIIFCWALISEIQLLSYYLRSLRFYKLKPTIKIFEQIKFCYKSIAKHILMVNYCCKVFISWILLLIIMFIVCDFVYGFKALIEYHYLWISGLFVDNIKGQEGREEEFQQSTTISVNNLMDSRNSTILAQTQAQALTSQLLVRSSVGYLTLGFLKLTLLGSTYWQAVKVNDNFKLLHILLNDFVTDSNIAAESTELYQAFRLLKLYVHSTMEFESPALLRIPIFTCMPYFGKRLHKYSTSTK